MTVQARAFDTILRLLRSCESEAPPFPPTELFNETWMLRLVLDAVQRHEAEVGALRLAPLCRWYSEARLKSPFLPRRQGDPLGEGFTNADAVLGEFAFQSATRAGAILAPGARHFAVVEAKMFSGLAAGVKNIARWSQASRNLACMALALQEAGRPIGDYDLLGFWVLAPRLDRRLPNSRIEAAMQPETIAQEVRERVAAYGAGGDAARHAALCVWEEQWFRPMLRHLEATGGLGVLTWDACIEAVAARDAEAGADLAAFYARCLAFSPQAALTPSR
jgi:hypothetical protein